MLGKPVQIDEARDAQQNGPVGLLPGGKRPPPIGWAARARACSTRPERGAARHASVVPITLSVLLVAVGLASAGACTPLCTSGSTTGARGRPTSPI